MQSEHPERLTLPFSSVRVCTHAPINAKYGCDWKSAIIEIQRRIDERGTKTDSNIVSAAHLPTAFQDFQQQHKGVVKALDTALGLGVFSAETFTTQVKETLTARIREHGNPTFSTAGLSRNQARKKIMDTYHLIKTDVVINTVRGFSMTVW